MENYGVCVNAGFEYVNTQRDSIRAHQEGIIRPLEAQVACQFGNAEVSLVNAEMQERNFWNVLNY